jgi:hypothetical protein
MFLCDKRVVQSWFDPPTVSDVWRRDRKKDERNDKRERYTEYRRVIEGGTPFR